MNAIAKKKIDTTSFTKKHRHWQKSGINVVVPRTVNAVLRGDKHTGAPSLDCTADPCNCTGCSEWD